MDTLCSRSHHRRILVLVCVSLPMLCWALGRVETEWPLVEVPPLHLGGGSWGLGGTAKTLGVSIGVYRCILAFSISGYSSYTILWAFYWYLKKKRILYLKRGELKVEGNNWDNQFKNKWFLLIDNGQLSKHRCMYMHVYMCVRVCVYACVYACI